MFIKVVKTFTQEQTTPKLEVVESRCQYRPGANGHFMHYSLIAKTIWCWFFFYTAPSSITCCRDEYKAENKVMCVVKPAFGWINSWKIRPKCQEKRENTFRRPPCVHGFQSSLTFLSLVLVNSKIDYEMKKKLSSWTADSGFKTLGWRSAVTRNRKWKTKQNIENVSDLKETIWRMKRSSK